jgi:hypothetical protein
MGLCPGPRAFRHLRGVGFFFKAPGMAAGATTRDGQIVRLPMTRGPLIMAKGRRAEWGPCTHEIKTTAPEQMYEDVIHAAACSGLSKAEWQRDLIGERLYGRLQVLTGRESGIRNADITPLSIGIPADTRDHLAALAFLEGSSVEAVVSELIHVALYGLHGANIRGGFSSENGGERAEKGRSNGRENAA